MMKEISKVNAGVIELPINGLTSLIRYYKSYGADNVPVILVAIYNTEQLADEIVQRLKDCTSNCGEGNNESN